MIERYTIKQVAQKLKISVVTIERLERSGKIPKIKRNSTGRRYFTITDMEKIESVYWLFV